MVEFGLVSLVVNQGSHSEPSSTSADTIPTYSPGVSRETSRYWSLPRALETSITSAGYTEYAASMAVTKIIEVVGSSPESSDGAVRAALDDARQSLRNIKAVDVVSTGLRGENLDEWRALVRISFLVERVSE